MQSIPFVFPGIPGVRCAFGTRLGGDIAVHGVVPGSAEEKAALDARNALLGSYGLMRWTELQQVHEDTFLLEPVPTSQQDALGATPRLPQADGHATTQKGHALCIKTADCQPLFLAHPKGCIAALHVGWRGNHCNFPASGVAAFCHAYGLDPSELHAVRGPSLGPSAAQFINFEKEWPESFRAWFDEQTRTMDLWRLSKDQLLAAGLREEKIYSLDLCTHSLHELFFSHRRKDKGRQANIIWME